MRQVRGLRDRPRSAPRRRCVWLRSSASCLRTRGPPARSNCIPASTTVSRFRSVSKARSIAPNGARLRTCLSTCDAGGVRIIGVAEHRDIDQVSRRLILPDLGIDACKIDPLVKPAADPIVTAIGDEVWESADVFVVPRFQPIASDHLHRALVAAVGQKPKEQPCGMIVAFARALV